MSKPKQFILGILIAAGLIWAVSYGVGLDKEPQYREGIYALQNFKWHDASVIFSKMNGANGEHYKYSQELNTYATARELYDSGEQKKALDMVYGLTLKGYNGPLSHEINDFAEQAAVVVFPELNDKTKK